MAHLPRQVSPEHRQLLRQSLCFTALVGLIAHGFQYLTLSPSHDYLMRLSLNTVLEGPISRGRFLEPVYNRLLGPGTTLPWTAGLFSLLWLGLTVYLVARLFSLSGPVELFLVAGILVANRSMISLNAVYLPFAGVFAFSCLAAVLAVCQWKRAVSGGGPLSLLLGALCTAVSLALYQSYLFTAITLILLCSLQSLLSRTDPLRVVVNGLASIAMLAVGGGLYLLGTRAACRLTGIPLSEGEYNSLSNLGENSQTLVQRLSACLGSVRDNVLTDAVSVYGPRTIFAVTLLLVLVCLALLGTVLLSRRPSLPALALGAVILLVLPVAMNGIRLLNQESHDLMHYAFWLVWLLPLILWQTCGRTGTPARLAWTGAAALLGILLLSNIQTANLVYVQKAQEFEAAREIMTNVMARVEAQEGYEDGVTPVVFLGTPGDVMAPLPEKDRVSQITGCYSSSPISYYHTYFSYFSNVLQRRTNVVLPTEALTAAAHKAALPPYPQAGSIALVDGTVVVNFRG